MRTIKQLSVEKEVLRQYSDLIYQVLMYILGLLFKYRFLFDLIFCRMSWKPVLISATTTSIIWGTSGATVAFLYWRALILFERNELTSNNIIL